MCVYVSVSLCLCLHLRHAPSSRVSECAGVELVSVAERRGDGHGLRHAGQREAQVYLRLVPRDLRVAEVLRAGKSGTDEDRVYRHL